MKSLTIIVAAALISWALSSTKIRTSAALMVESLEDRIVTSVGKGRVAIRLHQKQLNHQRETVINLTALRKFYELKRQRLDHDQTLEQRSSEQIADMRGDYQRAVERLKKLESKGRKELETTREAHRQICLKVSFLEEKLSLVRAMSGAPSPVDPDIGNEVEKLLESLELDVLRAEAELDLQI